MGIQGLLPLLKPHMKDSNLSEFRGRTVAVDGYAWLHKAVFGCAMDLCQGKPTTRWVTYIDNIIGLFHHHQIKVIMVFDGADLPAKAVTETSRAERRTEALAKANKFFAEGKKKEAMTYYSQAVDVSPAMAAQLIAILKVKKPEVQSIVAPYEADAQLAFLSKTGKIDAVVGEDSDTIPFGVKEMIFKLDSKSGNFQHLQLDHLFHNPIPSFDLTKFDQDMILVMCITAGCDYLPSVKNVGIRKAYELVKKHKGDVERILKVMRLDGLLPLEFVYSDVFLHGSLSEKGENGEPKRTGLLQYEIAFHKAVTTFKHQVIFDPDTCCMRHMNELNSTSLPTCLQCMLPLEVSTSSEMEESFQMNVKALEFLGCPLYDTEKALGIASGLLDPVTGTPFPDEITNVNIVEKVNQATKQCIIQKSSQRASKNYNRTSQVHSKNQKTSIQGFFSKSNTDAFSSQSERSDGTKQRSPFSSTNKTSWKNAEVISNEKASEPKNTAKGRSSSSFFGSKPSFDLLSPKSVLRKVNDNNREQARLRLEKFIENDEGLDLVSRKASASVTTEESLQSAPENLISSPNSYQTHLSLHPPVQRYKNLSNFAMNTDQKGIHQKLNHADRMVSECGIFDKFAMNYGTNTDDGRDMQWEYSVDAESGADILFNSSEVLRDATLKRQRNSSDAQEDILPSERFSQYSTGTDTAQKKEKSELDNSKFFDVDVCDSDSTGVDEAGVGLTGSVGRTQSKMIRPLHADAGLGGGLFDHFRCPN